MALILMYITNEDRIAKIADEAGIDWIFIDLETKGKKERQGHLDTVISKHQIIDIKPIRKLLTNSKLLVRVNPINEKSKEEIEAVINEGADIVMLPFFKETCEVKDFISFVNKKAEVCLLLETPKAVDNLADILKLDGIDYIHIGLNDLHLGYKKRFMFELLSDGTVERIFKKIKRKNIKFGFGGIARLGSGLLPAEMIITEHYRLKSMMAIVSRQFYDSKLIKDTNVIREYFIEEIKKIRSYEMEVSKYNRIQFMENKMKVKKIVKSIINKDR